MNRDIMILVLTVVRNTLGMVVDEYDEMDDEEVKDRLNHMWKICDHNVAVLERE